MFSLSDVLDMMKLSDLFHRFCNLCCCH